MYAELIRLWVDKVWCGHVIDALRAMPPESVHMVVTSPPYWPHRDYGLPPIVWGGDPNCTHRWVTELTARPNQSGGPSAKQLTHPGSFNVDYHDRQTTSAFCVDCGAWSGSLGLEPTPELYVAHLVEIFREVWRVLRPDGTVWINMGDAYWASGGAHKPHHRNPGLSKSAARNGVPAMQPTSTTRYKPKDLIGLPHMVAFALRDDGWWLRQDNVWDKKNPMPDSTTDRTTRSHEFIFQLAKSGSTTFWSHPRKRGSRTRPEPDYVWIHRLTNEVCSYCPVSETLAKKLWRRKNLYRAHDYYYDYDAIKEPLAESSIGRIQQPTFDQQTGGPKDYAHGTNPNRSARKALENFAKSAPGGRNKRSVWHIATTPYKGAHFSTFPPDLITPPILAGSSEKVCAQCGAPWLRQRELVGQFQRRWSKANADGSPYNTQQSLQNLYRALPMRPTCHCNAAVIPGVVLDPFAGSGTTMQTARSLHRSFVGIELSEKYIGMIEERLGTTVGLYIANHSLLTPTVGCGKLLIERGDSEMKIVRTWTRRDCPPGVWFELPTGMICRMLEYVLNPSVPKTAPDVDRWQPKIAVYDSDPTEGDVGKTHFITSIPRQSRDGGEYQITLLDPPAWFDPAKDPHSELIVRDDAPDAPLAPVAEPVVEASEPEGPAGPAKCEKHPRYRGLRKPRSDCKGCWDLYRVVSGIEKPAASAPTVVASEPPPSAPVEPQAPPGASQPPPPAPIPTPESVDPEAVSAAQSVVPEAVSAPEAMEPPQPAPVTPPPAATSQAIPPSPDDGQAARDGTTGYTAVVHDITGTEREVNCLEISSGFGQILAELHERISRLESLVGEG